MKMTVLMLTTYIGCAVATVTRMNAHGLVDSRLALIAVSVICGVHVCWKVFAERLRTNPAPKCLACQTELGVFHRFAHHRFCSEQHEQVYLAELEEVALARLQGARLAISLDSRVQNALSGSETNAEARELVKFRPANVAA